MSWRWVRCGAVHELLYKRDNACQTDIAAWDDPSASTTLEGAAAAPLNALASARFPDNRLRI
jgi:hypothetical protein